MGKQKARQAATQGTAKIVRSYLLSKGFGHDGDLDTFTSTESAVLLAHPELIASLAVLGPPGVYEAAKLASREFPTSISRESQVTAVATQGELLTAGFGVFSSGELDTLRIRNGSVQILSNGGVGNLGGGISEGLDLHNRALLPILLLSPSFGIATQQPTSPHLQ